MRQTPSPAPIAVPIRFCGHFSAISASSAVNLTAENAEDAEKDAEA
jgi:hypothetical protein